MGHFDRLSVASGAEISPMRSPRALGKDNDV
jgi:hypothetical protein